METISNITAAATKVIWGEPEANKEPISGATGDVSKGQPYDAGNLGLSEQEKVQDKLESGSHDDEPSADSNYTTSTTTKPSTTAADAKPRAMDADTSIPSPSLAAAASKPLPDDTAAPKSSSADIAAPKSSSVDTAAPKSSSADVTAAQPTPGDTTAQQNDTRAPEDENAQVDLKGPGPRPLNVVAKEHGGDAGRDHEVSPKTSESSSRSGANEAKDVIDDSDSKGSGQMYVKTSGLAADGGDFDATKPGAGKEADRLMDEKGIHHEEGKKDSSSKGHHKDKPSLSERIKAKLHKH